MPRRRHRTDTVPCLPPAQPLTTALTRVSSGEWVVSRRMACAGNTAPILGFIQLSAGRYEVTKIGGFRIEFSTWCGLDEAVAALSSRPLRLL